MRDKREQCTTVTEVRLLPFIAHRRDFQSVVELEMADFAGGILTLN
jgi:hypothetical protein